MRDRVDEQEPKPRTQTENEERHRGRGDPAGKSQTPGESVARVFAAFFGDHNRIGHDDPPSEKPLKHFKKWLEMAGQQPQNDDERNWYADEPK